MIAAALFVFFRCTRIGTAIRACADNYTGALVVGLDVKHLYALTFGLGAACVGAAGAMMVLIVDVTPSLGPAYTLLAFIIVIVGGLGSMAGALLGGVLIGRHRGARRLAVRAVGQEHVRLRAAGAGAAVAAAGPAWARDSRDERMIARLIEACRAGPCYCWPCCCWRCSRRRSIASDYLLSVLILILYFAYVGQAWNIMMGFAGQLSLGHALYVGLGGYVAAALLRAFRHRPVARRVRRACRSRRWPARSSAFSAFAFASRASISPFSPSPSPNSPASASIIWAWTGGRRGLFLPVAQYSHNDLWQPARRIR